MAEVTRAIARTPRWLLLWYGLATAIAVFTYVYGLDSGHIPKNGDEYPYEHITRTTAASGHWLPLASELPDLRNTKPPLLFWQGIASTSWGKHWTLWNLRWPSICLTNWSRRRRTSRRCFRTTLPRFSEMARCSKH